VKSIKYLSKLA